MKTIGILLTLLGTLSIYCCHSNQNLLPERLPKIFKINGLVTLFLALILLLCSLPKVVACFVWLILMIFIWSFVPFLALFKRSLNG